MSRTTNILLLMVMLATTQASMDFSIDTTWNNGTLDHTPVKLVLRGQKDGSLQVLIEAPFFNDPASPDGPSGKPFYGLWEYEVVEVFFLNDNEEYLEVEVCPWGQHIVLMLNGTRTTIRHSLPLEVTTQINFFAKTWTGQATIPAEYLPMNVSKFNAYAIHGSGVNRTYESLYPAPASAENPDFHALEYFQPIDLSSELPSQSTDPMSEFWENSLKGIFSYSITTNWKGENMDQEPIKITIQGFEAGIELNVTAPFFKDPKPEGPEGAFFGLWDYEVVEMFFLNDNDEYIEVEVGPWGHHILLLLKGERNTIKHSLELDYFAERQGNTWHGSAMIPPSYFPPNVTRMNAYAIHGVDEKRVYQALYPAPANSENPDFHRLSLFEPIDFEYQVVNNTEYSKIWEDAIDSAMVTTYSDSPSLRKDEITIVIEKEEVNEVLTSLGPLFVNEFTTEIPEEEEEVTMLSIIDNLDEKEPELSTQMFGINQADTKDIEQLEENEVKVSVRPLTRIPSIRRPSVSPIQAETTDTEQLEENEVKFSVRPLSRRPSIRRPTVSPIQTETTDTEQLEENEVKFSVRPLTSRPSIRRPTVSPIQAETTDTEQLEENEVKFSVRPLTRRPSIRRPTVSPIQIETIDTDQMEENEVNVSVRPLVRRPGYTRAPSSRSPARGSNRRKPKPVQILTASEPVETDNSLRPIQNRRIDDNRGSSGNFLPDQKFPTEVVRPTQFLRPIQRPVPQIVERPPQEEIIFNQQDEKLQIPTEGVLQQQDNVQNNEQSESFDYTDKDAVTVVPGTDENSEMINQEDNLQTSPLVPLELLHHPVCREAGLIPDQLRCMVFHECVIENGQWQLYSWRCKRGHYYDPHSVSCVRGRCNMG